MTALPAAAQDTGTPTKETLSGAYTGKVYSPYAKRGFPERPLWGDSHLHTSLSMDAGLFGNRLPPRDAYRFARGEEVVSSTGQAVRLSRPLDWLVIADHSDGMGLVGDIAAGKPQLLAYEQAARWNKGIAEGGDAGVQAALDLISTFSQGKMDPEMFALYSPGSKIYKNLWERVVADAEMFNDPGRFTAFIGFEWTSLIKGNNISRRSPRSVVRTRVIFGNTWPITNKKPAAKHWRSRTTATCRTASCSLWMLSGTARNSIRPMSRSATNGSRFTKRPRSRAMARRTRSCHRTTSSLITKPGRSATSTSAKQRPTTCWPVNIPARR
jgi:hypothetical protein